MRGPPFATSPIPAAITRPTAHTRRRLPPAHLPYLVNSIRVQQPADDYGEARVARRLRRWNRNDARSQFGGKLFAMTDPFWMLLAMHRCASSYTGA